MDDLEMALLCSLYVVLVQALIESQPTYTAEDHIMQEAIAGGYTCLDSTDAQLAVSTAALYDYRLSCGLLCFDDELRYWVKPRSTTWFSNFLVSVYDDSRWIDQFRMDKAAVADICYRTRAVIAKEDTNYRHAILTEIRVCCCLYKLAQGCNLLACSEQFAIGRSTVGKVIREVVHAVNVVYSHIIQWPHSAAMREVMVDFKNFCGMPSVHGAIDCTHVAISKPPLFAEDYYYFKTGGYSIVAQAVVDCKKQFTSVFVGLPGSVNDTRVLRKSALWEHVQTRRLMHVETGVQDGIPPYLLADKGYPCMSWMLTPFREDGEDRTVAETLYNRRHRRGRSVVENAFGLLKTNWRELHRKTDLHVTLVPDVFYTCCILHNLTIQRGGLQIEELMQRMALEAEHEMELRERGRWPFTAEEERDYNQRLENGEASGDAERDLVVYYLTTQPAARH